MKMPFDKLMELVMLLPAEDWELSLGALAERWNEPTGRVADAVTAVQIFRGDPRYWPIKPADTVRDIRHRVAMARLARGETDR